MSQRPSPGPAQLAGLTTSLLLDTALQQATPGATVRPPRRREALAGLMPADQLPRLPVDLVNREAPADLVAVRPLGQGGMGQVLLGKQRSLGREVALKTLRPDRLSPEHVAALVREGQITGTLSHPNIIPVHALGLDAQGHPVLVMKRIEGASFQALLHDAEHEGWRWLERATGAVDRTRASVEVLMRVALALEFAHERGVIHRDVKPENIMVGTYGEVYLVDWGVAAPDGVRAPDGAEPDNDGGIAGTPAYMAPEMLSASFGPMGPASDVYLLGATLHEVLTGRPRHAHDEMVSVIGSVLLSQPFAYGPEVPAELAALCNAATAREPRERPRSARRFREALADYLRHEGSARLTRSALERLAEVRALAAQAPQGSLTALHRAATECRFAFSLALRDWPDNAEAAAGLHDCLTTLAQAELAHKNPQAAREACDAMASVPAALAAEVQAMERRQQREREHGAELRRQASDNDRQQNARLRAVLVGVLGLWVMAAAGLFLWLQRGGLASLPLLTAATGLTLLGIGAGALVMRRRLLTNRANQRFVATALLVLGLMFLHRLLCLGSSLPLDQILTRDQLITGGALLASGIGFDRQLLWPGAFLVASAIASTVLPSLSLLFFSGATLLGLVSLTITHLAQADEPPDLPPPSRRSPPEPRR